MNKFISFLTAGALALSFASPAMAAKSQALSARYNLKVNLACQGKRALKRAECAKQFVRSTNPSTLKSMQRARACKGKVGPDLKACLETQKRVWKDAPSSTSSTASTSSTSSDGSSSSAASSN